MIVTGQITKPVTINIDTNDCFKDICERMGIRTAVYDDTSRVYRPEKENGKIVKLIEVKKVNKQGSEFQEPTGNEITDPKLIEIYEHCKAIKDYINVNDL